MSSRTSTVFRALHKYVWRRLPAAPRRKLLMSIARALAPSISAQATARPPLIIVGLFQQTSGLGAAARACHDALRGAGLPVYAVDVTTALHHEANFVGFEYIDGRGVLGAGTLIVLLGGPSLPLALWHLGQQLITDKHIIAHWFWELPELPRTWSPTVSMVHQFCTNTRFVANAIAPIAGSRTINLVSYPLAPTSRSAPIQRSLHHPFTALVIFNVASNFARKNPLAAIAAFRRAFGDDPAVRLIVKFANADHWPPAKNALERAAAGADNIELIGEIADQTTMDALYDRADVVVSLHRAEGLGLVIAEAMLRGIAVVATNWSGNTDFLTKETGFPVGYHLVPIADPQGNYISRTASWAEPDIEEASAALRLLRRNPQLRRQVAEAGRLRAGEFFAASRYVDQIRQLLTVPVIPG